MVRADQGPTVSVDIADNSELVLAMDQARKTEQPAAPLLEWIAQQKENGQATVLVCDTDRQVGRLASILAQHDIDAETGHPFPSKNKPGHLSICRGHLAGGFVWKADQLSVLTEAEIFGTRTKRTRIAKSKVRTELLAFSDLKQNDLVVHDEHGIGHLEGDEHGYPDDEVEEKYFTIQGATSGSNFKFQNSNFKNSIKSILSAVRPTLSGTH